MSRPVRHPLVARLFAREVGRIDADGAREHRARLRDAAADRVLEIGAGTGISFADYPPGMVNELEVVWPRLAGGCHASRDTAEAITKAGFAIDALDRFTFRPSLLAAPTAPYILGASASCDTSRAARVPFDDALPWFCAGRVRVCAGARL